MTVLCSCCEINKIPQKHAKSCIVGKVTHANKHVMPCKARLLGSRDMCLRLEGQARGQEKWVLWLQVYRQALRQLMQQVMSHDDDKMLRSAHLQLSAMLENKLVDFSV